MTARRAGPTALVSEVVRAEARRPQRLVLWLFLTYGVYVGLTWTYENLSEGEPLSDSTAALTFVVFCLAFLLREPWRLWIVFALSCVVLPVLDLLMPRLVTDGSGVFILGPMAIAAFAFAYARHVRLLALLTLFWLGWGVCSELRGYGDGFTLQFVVPVTTLMSVSGWAVGAVVRRRSAAERELALLAERGRRERIGLARELHDSVARDLTIIAMQSAVLRTTDRPEEKEFAQQAIEETARSGLDALKRLLVVLRAEEAVDERPTLVRDLESEVLSDAVAESARHLAMLGYQVTTSAIPPGLPRAAETTAVRVVREGTTNITKHAPLGVLCRLDIRRQDDELVVRVENRTDGPTTGRGRPRVPSTGLGIESISERLRLLGGSLSAGPIEDRWVLEARMPLTAPLAGSVTTSTS